MVPKCLGASLFRSLTYLCPLFGLVQKLKYGPATKLRTVNNNSASLAVFNFADSGLGLLTATAMRLCVAALVNSFAALGLVYGGDTFRDVVRSPNVNMTAGIPDDPWEWRNEAGWRFNALNRRDPWMEWLSVNSEWKKCAVNLADDVSLCPHHLQIKAQC